MPCLRFHRDLTRIFDFHLSGTARIGRGEDCDIALVGQSISRAHCEVYQRDGVWRVRDLGSRHGAMLNGEPIQDEPLCDGDRIELGELRALYQHSTVRSETTHAVGLRQFETLLSIDKGIHVTRSMLRAVEGPDQGKTWPLKWGRCAIGGPGSRVELRDPSVRERHCTVSFSRGRALLVPGRGPVVFSGEHLVGLTPLLDGEEFCIGSTRLRLEIRDETLSSTQPRFGGMRSCSPKMQAIFGTLTVAAGHAAPILIQGESGTGKELAARAIHQHSSRSGSFVAVNCGGVSGSLWESQLFGHEKGAFTGADTRRDGLFQQADRGTLFLDEIGDLPMEAQVKLLRALGEGEVRRVGGQTIERPDVRVIAATNHDLMRRVQQGHFRKDLFFRLSGFLVELPPLRERPEDIVYLMRHFLEGFRPDATLTPGALRMLNTHSWPGNVRELQQVLTRALCGTSRIT